jgi:hypothetical protein
MDGDTFRIEGAVATATPWLRIKGDRLQRAYQYRPWGCGWIDPMKTVWVDVPVVAEDASDDAR